MQPNFTASNKWISDTLEASRHFVLPVIPEIPRPEWVFSLVAHFLQHSALESASLTEREIWLVLKGDPQAFANKAVRYFPCHTVDALLQAASRAGDISARLRQSEVRLDSSNPFTAAYRPPPPKELRRAMGHLMQAGRVEASRSSNSSEMVGAALGSYFTLLTIHPLRDGNGRTARACFLGSIAKLTSLSPLLILGLCLLHQERNSSFHLAASLARMGEPDAILQIFHSSIEQAASWFGDDLITLASTDGEIRNSNLDNVLHLVLQLKNKVLSHLKP